MNAPRRPPSALPIVDVISRPPVSYDPARALEQSWPPLIGFPLEVARIPAGLGDDVFVCVLAVLPSKGQRILTDPSDAAFAEDVDVGVGDLVAVPWSLDLVTDPQKSGFVFGRIWGTRRAMMLFRVVREDVSSFLDLDAGAVPVVDVVTGIGASILGGGDGRTKMRSVWELSRALRVEERERWVEVSRLIACAGKPDALLELLRSSS